MNVAAELREHAERVEKGWVRSAPYSVNEACAVMWVDDGGEPHAIDYDAGRALNRYLGQEATLWNDRLPSQGGPVNRLQVAAALRRAADAWEREQEVAS